MKAQSQWFDREPAATIGQWRLLSFFSASARSVRLLEAGVGKLHRQPSLASSVSHVQDIIKDLFNACVAAYFLAA